MKTKTLPTMYVRYVKALLGPPSLPGTAPKIGSIWRLELEIYYTAGLPDFSAYQNRKNVPNNHKLHTYTIRPLNVPTK
jgi:hypothetical protein